jgi:hypothetical protein
MMRGWLTLVCLGSVLAISLAQQSIQPVELLFIVDDSPTVGQFNWDVTRNFMKQVIGGAKTIIEESTWQLGIITFSGRTIINLQSSTQVTLDSLIDQATYAPSTAQAGWDLARSMLKNEGRQGIATVIVPMPSNGLIYSANDVL